MCKSCDMKKQWKQVAFLKKRGEKMPRKKLPKQYGISGFRFRELYYYVLQYPEWEKEYLADGRGVAGGVHPRRCHMEGHDVYDAEKYVRHPMRQEHILQIPSEILLAPGQGKKIGY